MIAPEALVNHEVPADVTADKVRVPRQTTVANVVINTRPSTPAVRMESPQLLSGVEFLVNTGADPNLVRRSVLREPYKIDTFDRLNIRGITNHVVEALGATTLVLFGENHKFYVVNDDLPLKVGGLLGGDFLEYAANVSYIERTLTWKGIVIPFTNPPNAPLITIPARTVSCVTVNVCGPATGFLEQRNLAPEVVMFSCLA